MRKELFPESEQSAREDALHQKLGEWAQSLISRYDIDNQLTLLDYDPIAYPEQKLDAVFHEAIQIGKEQEIFLLDQVRSGANRIMGNGRYDSFVADILEAKTPYDTKVKVRYPIVNLIWSRLRTPRQDIATVTGHSEIWDIALVESAIVDAFYQASQDDSGKYKGFDDFELSDFIDQQILVLSPTLTRVAVGGVPIIRAMQSIGNVVTVPPVQGALERGVDRRTIYYLYRQAEEKIAEHRQRVHAQNRSIMVHQAPTGSTDKRILDETGQIVGLERKAVSHKIIEETIINKAMVWPFSLWLNNGAGSNWVIDPPETIKNTRDFNEIMDKLAANTASLSELPVEFNNRKFLGKTAVKSSLDAESG